MQIWTSFFSQALYLEVLEPQPKQIIVLQTISSITLLVSAALEMHCHVCGPTLTLLFLGYRRSHCLPATSVGLGMISEVGYLHENPEIEALLLRKGIQQINESEMLAIIDISLTRSMAIPGSWDQAASAHVLTGLEPFGILKIRKQGFKGNNPVLKSARAVVLARAIHEQENSSSSADGDLPAEVSKAREAGISLADAITTHVTKRFGDLVLISADKVSISKPLDGYGMDSMIAAEFRSWFYQAFKVDVPFLDLLSKTTTVGSLSKVVLEKVKSRT